MMRCLRRCAINNDRYYDTCFDPKLVEEIGIATEIGPKLRAALDKKILPRYRARGVTPVYLMD